MIHRQLPHQQLQFSERPFIALRKTGNNSWKLISDFESEFKDVEALDELFDWVHSMAMVDQLNSIVLQFGKEFVLFVQPQKRHALF
jgi:hypothetical protein